jgi:hypothetical protein
MSSVHKFPSSEERRANTMQAIAVALERLIREARAADQLPALLLLLEAALAEANSRAEH